MHLLTRIYIWSKHYLMLLCNCLLLLVAHSLQHGFIFYLLIRRKHELGISFTHSARVLVLGAVLALTLNNRSLKVRPWTDIPINFDGGPNWFSEHLMLDFVGLKLVDLRKITILI